MTDKLAFYSIHKHVGKFNEEEGDWSGDCLDFGEIAKGSLAADTKEETLKNLIKNFSLEECEMNLEEERHGVSTYIGDQIEDEEGYFHPNGKYLVSYFIYITMYQKII